MAGLLLLASIGFSVPQPATVNLAEYYLAHLDTIQTVEQRNSAILKCLAEIASIIDTIASKRAIQSELGGKFRAMLMSVDSRDKDVKTQYEKLFNNLNALEPKTTNAVNKTFANVTKSLVLMRTNVLGKMARALSTISAGSSNASAAMQANIANAIASHGQVNLAESLTYFAIFQGLIFISVYVIRKYVKNKSLTL
jgi:hypothetical protein